MRQGLVFLCLVIVALLVAVMAFPPTLVVTGAPVAQKTWGSTVPALSSADVHGRPSLSVALVNQVLAWGRSPAVGKGQALYDLSVRYGIDDAFALAFFWHESNFGVHGEASVTRSLGNLRCIPSASCVDQDRGGYAAFPSWEAGFEAWYVLLAGPLYAGAGLVTVSQIVHRYAPAADRNNEQAYAADVLARVAQWRAGRVEVR